VTTTLPVTWNGASGGYLRSEPRGTGVPGLPPMLARLTTALRMVSRASSAKQYFSLTEAALWRKVGDGARFLPGEARVAGDRGRRERMGIDIGNAGATGGSLRGHSGLGEGPDEAAIRAYARKRLGELGRRYYPFGIGAAFLAMLAGFFPTTVTSSQLLGQGFSAYAGAASSLGVGPSGSASAARATPGGASGSAGSSAQGVTNTSVLGVLGASSGSGSYGSSAGPLSAASSGYGSSGSSGGYGGSYPSGGYGGGSGSYTGGGGGGGGTSTSTTSSCPLPIPASTGTPLDPVLDPVLAQILAVCSELAGAAPAGAPSGLPAGAPVSPRAGAAQGYASPWASPWASPSALSATSSATPSAAGGQAARVPGPGSIGWVSAAGPLSPGAGRIVVSFALPSGAPLPSDLPAQLIALAADGVVPEVILLPPPGSGAGAAGAQGFATWARALSAKLPAAKLWAVATGVPTGNGGESLFAPSGVLAGLEALRGAEAPRGVPVGLWWPSTGTTSADRALWGELSAGSRLSGGLFAAARFVSVVDVGSLSCAPQSALRHIVSQAGAPGSLPVIASAVPTVRAAGGSTGSLACFASAASRSPGPLTGLVALSPLEPLAGTAGR
jgi:hypothetical protein